MDVASAPIPSILFDRVGMDARADAWRDLARDAAEPNCFYAPEWLLPALRHLAADAHVEVMEAHQNGRLIALMPVVVRSRQGRLPAPHVANWLHDYAFLGNPLLRKNHEVAGWRGLLDQIDAANWAPGFLHIGGMDAAGAGAAALEAACIADARRLRLLHRHDRALLHSPLTAQAYWETHVRSKKRKEIRRLRNRLAEQGILVHRRLDDSAELAGWCDDFLTLEASGWKGAAGTAIRSRPGHEAFFRDGMAAAMAAGNLIFLRMDLDGQPIAMLINFRMGRGSFSFKIAIDEAQGRFSPGVLIELDNLALVQGANDVDWMDSCAAPGHPMIDHLWAERRSIAQYRVSLKGAGLRRLTRNAVLSGVTAAETMAQRLKGRKAA